MGKKANKTPKDSVERPQKRFCIYSIYVAGAMEPDEAIETAQVVEPSRLDTRWVDLPPQNMGRKPQVKLDA